MITNVTKVLIHNFYWMYHVFLVCVKVSQSTVHQLTLARWSQRCTNMKQVFNLVGDLLGESRWYIF